MAKLQNVVLLTGNCDKDKFDIFCIISHSLAPITPAIMTIIPQPIIDISSRNLIINDSQLIVFNMGRFNLPQKYKKSAFK
jgi:hypothetical protein